LSNNSINILMLGDIIGTPGIRELFLKLAQLKKKENIHLAIGNGENADNGFGITREIIEKFKEYGIDVITSGNHIWSNDEVDSLLGAYDCLLRPANYPNASGKGWWTGNINGVTIGVVNLLGRYHMTPLDCPFQTLNKLIKNELKKCSIIIIDFHAEMVQEKLALAYDFDGKVTLLAGTHTHVQTADERILPNGTAYITDLGMCGGIDGVIGMERNSALDKIIYQTINQFRPSEENTRLQGIVAQINPETKKVINLKRFNI
jgi:2',3'-cyclic-nucleotide 2'-phosphodiesterase